MCLRGWLGCLILIAALAAARTNEKPTIGGFLGCRFSRSVCLETEACVNDHLFGNCQSRYEEPDRFEYYLDSGTLETLESEIYRLLRSGYTWSDFYTQCVLGNILLAYRRGSEVYDSTWCDRPERPQTDLLNPGALQKLENYFENYYDSLNEENAINEDKRLYDPSEYILDEPTLYPDKKDEVVNVHKYFAPKRAYESEGYYDDVNDNLDEMLDQLGDKDIDTLRYFLQGLDDRGLDISVPSDELEAAKEKELEEAEKILGEDTNLGYVIEDPHQQLPEAPYEGENTDNRLPVDSSAIMDETITKSQSSHLTPPEAKLLGDLLASRVNVEELPNKDIQQMIDVVEDMVEKMAQQTKQEEEPKHKKSAHIGVVHKEVMNEDVVKSPEANSRVHVKIADNEHKRANLPEGKPDKIDNTFDKQEDLSAHTNGPKLELVNENYGYIVVKPAPSDSEQAAEFLAEVERALGLGPGSMHLERVTDGNIDFKMENNNLRLNASAVAHMAVVKSELLRNVTGLKVLTAGFGKENKVSVEEATYYHGPKYFVITFVLCGVIAGCVLGVVVLYIIRRHTRSKEKIMQLAGHGGEGMDASSKDYQDLCRQRMHGKSSEKPEPINVAARVGSVSATEGNVHSPSSRSSTSSWSEEPVASNMDISTGHIVLSYMEDHLKNRDRLDQEWESLCAYDAEPNSIATAMEPSNMRKTRYSDVLPYDHSRVKLSTGTNVSGSDYINASTITDHDPRNPAYVATQGPLPHTVADFWQMVWEQGSVVIVQLTKLTETGVAMCHRYWPEEGSDLYHIYEVHLVSEHIWCDDYLVRSFYLKNLQTNETRTVTQFHFLTWSDLGVPASVKALLDFRRKVNKSYRGRSCPIVVHCSDGSGRTGTYMLIDMVLNRMSKGAKEIDIAATLEHIRDQRMAMVKTKEQFEFALASVAEEVHAILKALPQ